VPCTTRPGPLRSCLAEMPTGRRRWATAPLTGTSSGQTGTPILPLYRHPPAGAGGSSCVCVGPTSRRDWERLALPGAGSLGWQQDRELLDSRRYLPPTCCRSALALLDFLRAGSAPTLPAWNCGVLKTGEDSQEMPGRWPSMAGSAVMILHSLRPGFPVVTDTGCCRSAARRRPPLGTTV